MAMRFSARYAGLFEEEVIIMLNDNNYRLARRCLTLAILIFKLAEEVNKLLSMANNYFKSRFFPRYALP